MVQALHDRRLPHAAGKKTTKQSMISKIGVGLLLAVATLLAPVSAQAAASSTKKQVQTLFKQLKKLPNAAAPNAKVTQLGQKLAKLDPVKAQTYYKTGLTKLSSVGAESTAKSLAKTVTNIVKKSGLPEGKINSLIKQIDKSESNYTPPPYQAFVSAGVVVA
jgi:hypothetical protein